MLKCLPGPASTQRLHEVATMIARILVLSACLLLAAGYIARVSKIEQVPPRDSFESFPQRIGPWQGQKVEDLTPDVLAVLGVDEYLNRVYHAGARRALGLYIGYYESQRQGDTIHSPLNCLPGAGWQPLSRSYLSIPVNGGAIIVNQYVIQKGLDRQVVLYWYQSHGRIVANEYWGKFYTVLDAIRLNRTDAALVRVVSPVLEPDSAGESAASAQAVDFVKAMFPLLDRYLPA